ncbi:trans-sulfuration enzyme family protein [Erythrobacter mangrovi]|uniref:Aminotransferase class I/II-fold pyridoxal phosphate-dependent enzyme n=1 Tax=Erythrobacter mangrovi TaxID=2739433 RepID=A0A7D3XB94_9SPHN|nr:aminotransferase class I/II-fold pyridoxal phosphate-dependent enzyme [Erythrobacter mangrovi]QKG71410.1 aminotransferase class I/II-fold pyridoxal phosphate-dependent enzyme [Erythrobacter mangrovi]
MTLQFDPQDELVCIGSHRPLADGGSVLPPIAQASLFRQPDMETLFDGLSREHQVAVYSRGTNPTLSVLEDALARLERGEACKGFASGMGAIAASLTAFLESGDHVLFAGTIYGPTIELAQRLEGYGVSWSRAEATDLDGIAAQLRPETRVLYMESPGSMLFGLLPVADLATMARDRGIITMLDNSVATPLLQKPLELGVDLVLHSCSKYIGGHSDLVGGAVVGSVEHIERIFRKGLLLLGAAMPPLTAWLCLRGLMTLPVRLAKHHADALSLASWLAEHPRVRRVFHPALTNDPLLARQMRGHSGLFSFELDDGFADAIVVADRLRTFGRAVSWGGPESLVMTGHKVDPAEAAPALPASLLRLSVGLEGVATLQEDLGRALG